MHDPARAKPDGGLYPPGTLLGGRFRIKEPLYAEREMHLYRASDAQSGSDVSLRVVFLQGPGRALLERVLAKTERLSHQNLATLLGVVAQPADLLIASEWLDGHRMREVIDAQRAKGETIGAVRAHTLLGHVVAALEYVHPHLPHGGLQPDAIWITRNGRVKVADLGIGAALPTLARRGGPAGAPGGLYMAPEVAAGGQPSIASDVYSLGAILFELVAGTPPIPPLQPPSRLVPDVPPAVDAVIGRALLPQPRNRYASPADMLKALATAIGAAEAAPAPTPDPSASGTAARAAAGRSFDVSAVAGLSQEEARWLVQKDRLDFGPFSLEQVKAQIDQGAFGNDNLIVDMDTGARQKIADHPQLADYARAAERRLEQNRRAQADHAHEKVERKKSRATFIIIGVAVLALGGALTVYLGNRKAALEGELASRVGEGDIDDFLKGVKVDFKSTKRTPPRRATRGGGGGKDDPFETVTNLGDVSGGGADEILSDGVIQGVMMGNYRKLVPCIMEERRRSPGLNEMDLEFIITGGGKVSAVKVNGQRQSPFAGCVLSRMQSFNFPKYNGSKTVASWSMAMK